MCEITTFCKNIKFLRERNQISKKMMCKILKIGAKSLNKIENGILPPRTRCDVLIRACCFFNLTPQDLLSKDIYG